MLVHQVLVNGHPSFAKEIMYTSQRGMRERELMIDKNKYFK